MQHSMSAWLVSQAIRVMSNFFIMARIVRREAAKGSTLPVCNSTAERERDGGDEADYDCIRVRCSISKQEVATAGVTLGLIKRTWMDSWRPSCDDWHGTGTDLI